MSNTFYRKNIVNIDIVSDKSHTISLVIRIGIGCAIGGVALAAIIVVLFLIRKRKAQYHQFDNEGIEIKPLTETQMVTQNSLAGFMSDDDPFEDD